MRLVQNSRQIQQSLTITVKSRYVNIELAYTFMTQ